MDSTDPARWQRINDLFHAAADLAPQDFDRFLADECGGDEGLRAEVDRLVRAHRASEGFLAVPAAAAIGFDADDRGQRIGAYRLVREIGRGGMGAVYLAERVDDAYRKQVALKLVQRGMESEAVLRRFLNERQILASLEHAHIARLLDGGTTDEGRPYLVMEYIDGEPIGAYCDARRLGVTARLELFRQACSAVSYAHQHLVVHRDIKPTNILVTPDGAAKLLDFGIARLLNPAHTDDATVTVVRALTPRYASPEQIDGRTPTTLSDVYSLGVVLYELLTGRSPYPPAATVEEMAQAAKTVEPERPAQVAGRDDEDASAVERARLRDATPASLRARLRGDLDTIVAMALRKEPARRYPSVEALSADVQRHLLGRPVAARKDTIAYLTSRFVRRNRTVVAAAALLLLSLVGGIVATTWQARRARLHEEQARAEAARAERRFQDLRTLTHALLFEYHDAIKDLPGATPVRERLVKDALAHLDAMAAEPGAPSLARDLAAAYERVGDVQGGTMFANLGDTAGAIASYRKALDLRQQGSLADATVEETRALALNQRKLALLLWETGAVEPARDGIERACTLLQSVVQERPSDVPARMELARALDYAGMIRQELGDLDGAQGTYRRVIELYGGLSADQAGAPDVRRSLSTVHEHAGTVLLQAGRLPEALAENTRALELRRALMAEFPLNTDYKRTVVVSYYNEGEILARMGRTRDALASYRRDLALVETLAAADRHNEQFRGDLAYALIRQGDMLLELGDARAALASHRRSLALRAQDVAADPTNLWKRSSLIEAHAKIGKALAAAGDVSGGLAACARTVALMQETAVDPANAAFRGFFADTYADLAEIQARAADARGTAAEERRRRWATARDLHARGLAIWEDLKARGALSGTDAAKPEGARKALARCDAALGRQGAGS